MRNTLTYLLTIVLTYAFGLFLPWWSVALAACLAMAALRIRPWPSFLLGFLAACTCWGGWTLARSLANEHILAHRMSAMILGIDNPWLIIGLTAAIGGLMGGLGGLCGSLFMSLVSPPDAEQEATDLEETATPAPES